MISPKAVKAFLDQQRDNFTWLKALPRQDMLDWLSQCEPVPDTSSLGTHQLASLIAGIVCPTFAFFLGMGTGKSVLSLRLLDYWHRAGTLQKAVVLVPSQEAVYNWENELIRWKFPMPSLALATDTSVDKAGQWLQFEQGIILVSYPSLNAMVSRIEKKIDSQTRKETDKGHRVAKRSAIDLLFNDVQGVVYDESTEAKQSDSLTFRVCRAISKRVPIRYALAGRPFGRDPTDLWAQHYIVDHGESLGSTLGLFRDAFCTKKKRYFGGPHSFEFKFRAEMEDTLHRLSQHRSIRYSTEECVDLPPLVRITREFKLPDATFHYYELVLKHLCEARGDRDVIRNDFLHLRQLSSGFMGFSDEESGAKAKVEFDGNPKLDLLVELLKQIPIGRKAVIFHEFIWSGDKISQRLKKEKIKAVWLWSGTADRRAALHRFQNDPEYTVLVLNHMLGSYSLNLQAANYVFYYESPVGVIDRDQSEYRCWRQGQSLKVIMTDLCMTGGVDSRILDFHREGQSLFDAIVRDPKKALNGGTS